MAKSKPRRRSKSAKQAVESKEIVEKKSEKQASSHRKDDNNNLESAPSTPIKKSSRLPRQLIRVQRSEPTDGIIRNELRFVSYSAKDESGKNPVEMHVVAEAFGALISRLRELNISIPEIEENLGPQGASNNEVNDLRQKLAASEEECERLRKHISHIRNVFESDTENYHNN